MHTSAKARLTSVAIRIRIQIRILDPDRHQNLIICPLAHYQPSLRISCKYVRTFYAKLLTNKQRRKHILLGGGNNEKFWCPFVQIDKSDRLCIRFMYANKMMGLEYLSKSNLRINESYAAFTPDAMPRGAVRCLALRCFPLSTRLHISPRCGENDASCRTAPRGISVDALVSVVDWLRRPQTENTRLMNRDPAQRTTARRLSTTNADDVVENRQYLVQNVRRTSLRYS